MRKVTAKDFARNFGRWREVVQYDTVAVTAHNRVTGFFISIQDYTEYSCLKALAPKERTIQELTEETIKALPHMKMGKESDRLHSLLEIVFLCVKQLDM